MRILEFHLSLAVMCCMFHIVSSDCSEYYNSTSGSIRSLESTTDASDLECTYTIQTPQRRPILLTFKEFNLQQSPGCVEDYVEILEDTAADTGSKLCGKSLPRPVIIISGFVKIKFISHRHSKTTRFLAEFKECEECVERVSSNGGKLQVIDLKSQQKPTDMVYLFEPPPGETIMLQISTVNYTNNEDCQLVQIKNGTTYNSPVIASYCGGSKTDSHVLMSNRFTVTLHTEKSDGLKGFSATYRSTNGNTGDAPMAIIQVGSVKEKVNNGESSSQTGVITVIGAVVFSMVVALAVVGLIVWRRYYHEIVKGRRETTISNSREINGYGTLHSPKNSKRVHSKGEINVVYNEHYSDPGIITKRDGVPCVVTNIDNIDCSAPSVITNMKENSDGKGIRSDNCAMKDKDFAIEEGVQYSFSLTSERKSSVGSHNSSNGSCHNQHTDERFADDYLFQGNDSSDNVFDSATLRISDNSMIA